MKISHYDVLQISPKASLEIIQAAYQRLEETLAKQASEGNQEARNQLLFLNEAYSVLSSPERRSSYDASLLGAATQPYSTQPYAYQTDSTFLSWWGDSKTSRILIAIAIFAAVFSAYKFMGQRGEQKIQAEREIGSVRNDAYRAESERTLIHGAVQNQDKLIDKSYDIASREAERRRVELEYRANAGTQQLDMQRQRQEAQLQEQRWRQEQFEKDRQAREAQAVADAPKRQLCNMYALNGNTRDAQAAGCYRY